MTQVMTQPCSSFSANLVAVRRNPWVMGLAASPLAGTLACVLAGILVRPVFFALTFHTLAAGVALSFLAWRRNWRPVTEPVEVRADARGVTVGGRLIPRARIRAGFVLPGAAPRVLLRISRGLPVELQGGSTEEARALLRALGLDASQSVAEFRTLSRVMAKRRYGAGLGAAMAGVMVAFGAAMARMHDQAFLPGLIPLLAFVAFAGLMALAIAPTKLRVGADGIALAWLWRRRFIGYDEIDAVYRYDKGWGRSRQIGLRIILRSGEEVAVPIQGNDWTTDQVALIEERIREARESYRRGDSAADAAVLRRGERHVRDWVTALRSIGAGANAGMRTPPLPRERLFRVVEDPAAPPAERAAAAVALGIDLDDEGRARLRTAAEASAAPRLRIAIERAASGAEEDEVEAALEELDAEESESRERAT